MTRFVRVYNPDTEATYSVADVDPKLATLVVVEEPAADHDGKALPPVYGKRDLPTRGGKKTTALVQEA